MFDDKSCPCCVASKKHWNSPIEHIQKNEPATPTAADHIGDTTGMVPTAADLEVAREIAKVGHDLWEVYGPFHSNWRLNPERLAERLARVRQQAVAEKWQPIETAPKNEAVTLYASGPVFGHFNTTNNLWWTKTNGRDSPEERLLNSFNKPTHWQPLPAAPTQEKAG